MTIEIARDPICGRSVEVGLRTPMSVHGKRSYYFCSWACQTVFEAFPDAYLAPEVDLPEDDRKEPGGPDEPGPAKHGGGSLLERKAGPK